jgi:putative transposase
MRLSAAGAMVQAVWEAVPEHYAGVELDAFVVMPKTMSMELWCSPPTPLQSPVHRTATACSPMPLGNHRGVAPTEPISDDAVGAGPRACPTLSLPDVVHRFKTLTTRQYIRGVRENGWTPFKRRLWQRNYYEHVIRSDRALQHIRTYIESNPLLWGSDQLHPNNPSKWWREDSRGGAAPLMTTPAAAIAPADPG